MAVAARMLRFCPTLPGTSTFAGSFTNVAVDTSAKGVAWLFQSLTADPITHLGFRYGARTGTPPTYKISLQGIGTASLAQGGVQVPNGTIFGGGTPAEKTFTPPADATWDGSFQWIALDNSYTPAVGDFLASCVEHSSGTVDGSNNSSFTTVMAGFTSNRNLPRPATKNTTWSSSAGNNWPVFGYRTASGRFGFPVQSLYSTQTAATSGHRSAVKLTIPGAAATYVIDQIRFFGRPTSDSGFTWNLKVWDSGGSVLQTVTIDSDIANSSSGNGQMFDLIWPSTLGTLTGGQTYYFGCEVAMSFSGGEVGIRGITCASADDAAAIGSGMLLSTFDGSSWTDQNVSPFSEIVLKELTEPSGGGGGNVILLGGMRGGIG